jgi:hypothetical protein
VIQANLEQLGQVRVTVKPGLDLPAVQLALDCVQQNAACLRSVAASSGVQVLVAPTLERKAGRLELTLVVFDARAKGGPRRATHVENGDTLTSATLDAIPDMLRKLFGLEPEKREAPAPAATPAQPGPREQTAVDWEPVTARPVSEVLVGPIVLASIGVVAIAGGVTASVLRNDSQDDYDDITSRETLSRSDADRADDKASEGTTQAALATVMYGVGAAAIVAAGIWFAAEMAGGKREEATTAFAPIVGRGELGVGIVHRGVGL